MNIAFYSLHWDNVNGEMLKSHKEVMKHFNIPMTYHDINMNHGEWMEQIIKHTNADVIVILEPDCIPLDINKFISWINFAYQKQTFVGIAQVSNHIAPYSHIYAAPGFYVMAKQAYLKLGQPSFRENHRSDTAEEICYIAETQRLQYRALMPICFDRAPTEGVWPLSCLGYYGIGTVFENTVYHLYQSRKAENIELFIQRCKQVINGQFTVDGMYPSTILI